VKQQKKEDIEGDQSDESGICKALHDTKLKWELDTMKRRGRLTNYLVRAFLKCRRFILANGVKMIPLNAPNQEMMQRRLGGNCLLKRRMATR
jgi:hypothetical protein